TGRDINHQFRSYDRNQIALTAETWTPSASSANITSWNSYAKDWSATSTANYVYINVWNYDPSWKVEVTENGRALSVTRVTIKDPLHLIAYTAKRLNANKSNSFPTSDNNHTFRVQASSPTSTLEIKVTDRFGNVYTESMTRPKNFNASVYK
ncbi:MAG: calcineurin-like phosphoesterase C-terminal domain-containing protein, partial [Bacteroidales bacterium]|nr:calcineurin-like phosphoesterase C-terminal domain-containing protein [Bacteroidales bacterium]